MLPAVCGLNGNGGVGPYERPKGLNLDMGPSLPFVHLQMKMAHFCWSWCLGGKNGKSGVCFGEKTTGQSLVRGARPSTIVGLKMTMGPFCLPCAWVWGRLVYFRNIEGSEFS